MTKLTPEAAATKATPRDAAARLRAKTIKSNARVRQTSEAKLTEANVDQLLVYALGGDESGLVPALLEAARDECVLFADLLAESDGATCVSTDVADLLFSVARKMRAARIVYERLHEHDEKGAA